ncbi:hypothetical protein DRQ50_08575 [bacterium]|nr:MAG: hypothetical protein DRQ50_08575 [bacterium]
MVRVARYTSRYPIFAVVLLAVMCGAALAARGASAPVDTLVLVNGDPITTADFDRLIMEAHSGFESEQRGMGTADELLEKRIRDYLIIQDAMAAGYDTEPRFQEMIDDKTREFAIQAYVKDHFQRPETAPADSVRAFFDRFYWRLQYRRISVMDPEQARELRAEVLAGADMDALARELSVDSQKLKGGLSNLLYWADVENRIRDQVRDLDNGGVSEPFPYNDATSFVRVEQLLPVDEEAFARFEPEIAAGVLGTVRQRAWDAFVNEQIALVDISEDLGSLAAVITDSSVVLTGDFLKDDPTVVIGVPDGFGVTGTELRKMISHEYMQDTTIPFATRLADARQQARTRVALAAVARRAGYHENEDVMARLDRTWEKALIEAYLNDTVVARIRFRRDEIEEFYTENSEVFRGPAEVRLDIMILDEEAEAKEASARLRDGADFGYIFKQYHPDQNIALGKARFIKITELSQPFRDELDHMEAGQSSNAVSMPMGWMVFRLDERRQGAVPPLPEVEMEIRRVIFQRKFNAMLDEHVELLTEQSEITRWPERIEAYLQPTGEGSR